MVIREYNISLYKIVLRFEPTLPNKIGRKRKVKSVLVKYYIINLPVRITFFSSHTMYVTSRENPLLCTHYRYDYSVYEIYIQILVI